MVAWHVLADEDPIRAQENWYKDQAELNKIDKSLFKPKAASDDIPICLKCGRKKVPSLGEEVVMRLP